MTADRPRELAPLVALTATVRQIEGVDRVRVNATYIRAVESVGLIPVVIPPLDDAAAAVAILNVVAGLVLTGGEDVDPALYGEAPHPELGPVNCARDATELAMLAAARERGVPTLAICRGVQVVNVGLGGTLIQDLPSQHAAAAGHDFDDQRDSRVHQVRLEPASRLGGILGSPSVGVNSIHHQAVDRLGDSLRISARADDGVIEGVESADERWWMVGVQWHPEELTSTAEPWDRRLFAAFADACRDAVRARISSASTSLPAEPGASASPASGGAGRAAHR